MSKELLPGKSIQQCRERATELMEKGKSGLFHIEYGHAFHSERGHSEAHFSVVFHAKDPKTAAAILKVLEFAEMVTEDATFWEEWLEKLKKAPTYDTNEAILQDCRTLAIEAKKRITDQANQQAFPTEQLIEVLASIPGFHGRQDPRSVHRLREDIGHVIAKAEKRITGSTEEVTEQPTGQRSSSHHVQ